MKQLSLKFGDNSEILFSLIREILSPIGDNISIRDKEEFRELSSKLENIFRPPYAKAVALYCYLQNRRAVTLRILQKELGLSYTSLSRALNLLIRRGLIVRVERALKARGRRGPRSIIYALPDHTKRDLELAHRMELMRTTQFLEPVLKARNLVLSLMGRRGVREISYRDLISLIRREGLATRFAVDDIAKETIRLLKLDGVEVIL